VADLDSLHRRDPQTARAALHKISLLERDPYAGEPLLGRLVGFRKLKVGDRHWRIVWRVTKNTAGATTVEISSVIWAIGARKDSAVYDELWERLNSLPDTPVTRELRDLLERFGLETPPPAPEPAPPWLIDRLTHKAGLSEEEARALPLEEAITRWEEWMSRPHD